MKTLFKIFYILLLIQYSAIGQNNRWLIKENTNIEWKVNTDSNHIDNIEMSGLKSSTIVHYGISDKKLIKKLHLVFPMLRTIPNDTHASLAFDVDTDTLPKIKVENNEIVEIPSLINLDGLLNIETTTKEKISILHQLYPSVDQAAFFDKLTITNQSSSFQVINIPKININKYTKEESSVYGAYQLNIKNSKYGIFKLAPNESINVAIIYSANIAKEGVQYYSENYELEKRKSFVANTNQSLVFNSPDNKINNAFNFAKIRASESIYNTRGGLMHGPGGGRYYAAIWANDQAEYANPFFPFLGNNTGNESAINSFRHFSRYINDEFRPIPSSIIAEGTDYWNGAGDRGDMAMIAYGAGRFALAYGDKETAKELWPLITWCLEYCKRKINVDGVVASDSDELEGRFPAGDANLNTSSLYYDALISATYLAEELGIDNTTIDTYKSQSIKIKDAIEKYFGATIDGYATYKYYDGNDQLRAWICTPLTVGIYDRSETTIEALFSDKLWTDDGLASVSGSTTFWDRATLYALRGVYASGETSRATKFLEYYSNRRLLGDHVPYPIEAYPEGNQRHLSAESALYCRVITEGIWGIRPIGLNSFIINPQLPEKWNFMSLENIKAFNDTFNLQVNRTKKGIVLQVTKEDKVIFEEIIKENTPIKISL